MSLLISMLPRSIAWAALCKEKSVLVPGYCGILLRLVPSLRCGASVFPLPVSLRNPYIHRQAVRGRLEDNKPND